MTTTNGAVETDPVLDCIKDGNFVKVTPDQVSYVTMDRFKDLYEMFRRKYNMGPIVKWNESVYRPAFNENHITTKHERLNGPDAKHVLIARGIEDVYQGDLRPFSFIRFVGQILNV